MKRSTRFLIAFTAAALTFGTLRAFVGPAHWNRWHNHPHHCYEDSQEHHHWRDNKHGHSSNAQAPENDRNDHPDSSRQ
ncbi:hypothetical protein [Xanthocytophaga agilis]|uniref:Secreted protein n=1 Tax=Xanthocytophaga agilis TaxID=3048010 RepID=A0AAE3UEV9_9BACT|nr:hypothetical protein [Xanthocytophaga agilis]MDJ1503173.1 hypothetical protein [Xanthocytophaga agilis]